MTTDDPKETAKDLALPATEAGLQLLGVSLGLTGHIAAAAAAAVAGAGTALARAYLDRKAQKEREKLRRLLTDDKLNYMMSMLQAEADDEFDLFGHVINKSLEDDEDAKTPIYQGILDWLSQKKPPFTQVRTLSHAVRQLSYLEIHCFLTEVAGQQSKKLHQHLFSVNVLWNRLSSFGLSQGAGVRRHGSPTDLGTILAEYCPLDELPKPDTSPQAT